VGGFTEAYMRDNALTYFTKMPKTILEGTVMRERKSRIDS